MSSSDSLYPVSSLIDLMDIQGGAQPPAKTFKNNPEEGYVRFVQIRDFETDAHLTYIQALPKWRYCTERDVLIARYGASVGRICRGVSGAYNVALAKVVPKDADLDFLYHLLRTRFFQDPLAAMSGRSAQAGFNKEDLAAIKVPHPSIDDQKKIVAALNCLDERIDLLRETNATLEAIAQALFKSWFVDFDPVRAKMEGRAPEGMDEVTAALFPDSFEESELGLVPRGWAYLPFIETVDVIGGGTPKTSNSDYWDGDIPWYSVVDAPSGSDTFVVDTEKHITEAGLAGSSTKLLPKGTTIISARGTVGKLAVTGQAMAMNQSCYGLRGKACDSYFTYFSTFRLVNALKARSHGSVFDTITRDTLATVTSIYPAETKIIDEFEKAVEPIMERILLNLQSAKNLADIRDTLLPRLISGQLRLSLG